MTVYVDNVKVKWRGKEWCHLVADSIEELHAFANTLGLRRSWFQANASYPHYDVTLEVRNKALLMGAELGTRAQIIGCARHLKAQVEKLKYSQPQQLRLCFEHDPCEVL
ncbi:hypothetical protein AZSI13_16510 [Azospira sp. I13]|uniref:DUF4031 domain-containing protein n=1 Tax=Azospira sp. I13 TaxID=1765050 RepID=UPI000D3F18B6|nr:DUF4031 domain-containing protein [Azospira sp. I13]GBG02324.1 hypothetical protein AZSI13_16510 [Azospira sp. I13]